MAIAIGGCYWGATSPMIENTVFCFRCVKALFFLVTFERNSVSSPGLWEQSF